MKVFHKNLQITLPIIFVITLTVINIFITRLPLLGILGYEFSSVNAFVLCLIGGIYTVYVVRRLMLDDFIFNLIHFKNIKFYLIFIAIPFLIGFISSILFSKCPLLEGILFYLVITIPAYVFGISVGVYSAALSKKYGYVIFLVSFVVLLILPLRELFFNPQVYFHNPIIGYFPGTVYDEGIRISRLLIAYRILNLSFAVLLVYLAFLVQHRKLFAKATSLVGIILIVIIFSSLKPALLLSTNKEALDSQLQSTITTENFVVHFKSKSMFVNISYVALLHEYCLDQAEIQMDETFHKKIDSYIFRNREEKQQLMGAGNANVAKPWLKQVYLNYGSYEQTLKHELVHVVAADFGTTPLKVAKNFNSAMIEGLAVAIDDNYDGWSVHHLAKLAWQSNYRVSIPTLFEGANFFSQTSSLSYIYAGSFIKYLTENFGLQKVKLLYSTLDFEELYGKNIEQLAEDYYRFLENYKIDFNRYQAQLYFGSMPIFKKFCPRFAATQTRVAYTYLQQNNLADAFDMFKSVYSYSNSYSSLIGMIRTLSKEKKYSDAVVYLKKEINKFKTDQNYFILELTLGDLLIESNQYEAASAVYDSLLSQNPHIDYSNEVMIRKSLMAQDADSLKFYLNDSDSLKLRMLIRLNEKEIRYFNIPRIISLAENTKVDISTFLTSVKLKFDVGDCQSSFASLEISKYFLRRMDLENAQFFAIKAVNANLDSDTKHVFVENLRMVNWFKNFSNEVKVN